MFDAMTKEEDVCLVQFVVDIGGVENSETPPTFIMHGNISNVESVHYVATTNYVKVEIMQLVVI
jgi:hypothetical protein